MVTEFFTSREGERSQQFIKAQKKAGPKREMKSNAPEPTGTPRDQGGLVLPKIGSIEDGYRFLGGDPGDHRNWVKVQVR
jgi:hypothetical protein